MGAQENPWVIGLRLKVPNKNISVNVGTPLREREREKEEWDSLKVPIHFPQVKQMLSCQQSKEEGKDQGSI